MLVLRADVSQPITGSAEIALSLSEHDKLLHEARVRFEGASSHDLLEDVRWLMEEFLGDATAAGPVRAAATKTRMLAEGDRLFRAIFEGTKESEQLWRTIEPRLAETRIELFAPTAALAATLWELITPPRTGIPLGLSVDSIVRVGGPHSRQFGVQQIETCRVLLITSRPSGSDDVSYRSIAAKVFSALQATRSCAITFLRPATFPDCARVLRDAHASGRPFHIVHFDGHGLLLSKDSLTASDPETYIVFEDSGTGEGRLISGSRFANLLADTGPTAVVLNACRSALITTSASQTEDASQALANSFSHELITGGVRIVVAMNYNVYVASAIRFMAEFYRQLSHGRSIVTAVALARKDMATESRRIDGLSSFHIDDWIVPVVFQAGDDLAIRQGPDLAVLSTELSPDLSLARLSSLPPEPDLGFIGADDGLLGIDRAFDEDRVVLIHGLAGAGKTAIAVEFARWYFATGGLAERPLFTSFEEKRTIQTILAELEPLMTRRAGPKWSQLTATERSQLAPELLAGQSLLWIWDNIETLNRLSGPEQAELTTFLRNAAAAGVKFLLTSRGNESTILGHLPTRIQMPPLRLSDSAEFARTLIGRLGHRAVDRHDLIGLLVFCEGNPLTLTVALANLFDRFHDPTARQIDGFIAELRSGQAALEDENTEDRTRSLTASLQTGFAALNQKALRLLALLYLFRRYANVNVLFAMFRPIQDGVFPLDYDRSWTLREFSTETPPSLDRILRRAAEVGLLRRSVAQHYWLHPALHLHLKKYFRRFFPQQAGFQRAARAFAESLGAFVTLFTISHSHGLQDKVLTALSDEEDNMRRAFALSREFGWHQATIGLLHGLFTLYWHTGRRIEWALLLTDLVPEFVDSSGRPHPGKERWWTFVMDQVVRMEMWRRDFRKAGLLARAVLESEQRAAAPLESIPAHLLSPPQNKQLQSFAISLSRVADILRECDDAECLGFNERALAVYIHIEDPVGTAIRLFNLGHVFKNLPMLRDLERAEEFYRRAYESYPEPDDASRLQCLAQLGSVALQRLKDELGGQQRPEALSSHLDAALEYYETVLRGMAPDDILGLADVHNQLGVAFQYLEDEQNTAFEHFRMAIEYFDQAGESYEAASSRNNAAQVLRTLRRYNEAIVLAREALAAFESFDPGALLAIHLRQLVARLEHDIACSE
jgi:tetratricopeptide (TPR) repeat protein